MGMLKPWLPALVWAAAVWFVGGIPDVTGVPDIRGLDKLAHFGLYGILGFLLGYGWARSGTGSRWLAAAAIALALLMGAADERRQSRLSGRSEERLDWVADAAGAVSGFAFAGWLYRRRLDT